MKVSGKLGPFAVIDNHGGHEPGFISPHRNRGRVQMHHFERKVKAPMSAGFRGGKEGNEKICSSIPEGLI